MYYYIVNNYKFCKYENKFSFINSYFYNLLF